MPRARGREPRLDVRRYRAKDGTQREYWGVRFYDADGVCRRVTCASRAEAEFERARLALDGLSGAPGGEDGAMALEEFWPVWLADARQRLAPSSVKDYEYYWRRRVAPQFAAMAMRDIKPRAVSQWRARMAAEGVGRESIRKAMVLLQAMLTVAIEWGEATSNPVAVVRKPRQGRLRAIEVIEPVDVERLRRSMLDAGDERAAAMVAVLAYTGMRPAEVLGLERRHVRDDTVLVEQAVSFGELKIQKTGRVYRTIDLLDALHEDLARWFAVSGVGRRELLFPRRSDGRPWQTDDWNNWRNRIFHEHTRTIGLGTPRPYDLRHSFVSLLVREQRASIVDIADQMGHSPTETLKDYAHVMREHRRKAPAPADEQIAQAREAAGTAQAHDGRVPGRRPSGTDGRAGSSEA